jgi:hypothetical protein
MPSGTTTPWIESQSSRPPTSSGSESARGETLPAVTIGTREEIALQPGIASAASRSITSSSRKPVAATAARFHVRT